MRSRKNTVGKIYPKYQPYPVTWDLKEKAYSPENASDLVHRRREDKNGIIPQDFHDLIGEPTPPDWVATKPLPSNDERAPRPLRLLQSLFADRLSFLQRALDELESAKKERQQLIRYALNELDPEIQECEVSLSALKAAFNNSERRHNLERRLFELKRERRREALMSWRDLVWLRGEIRKLQREIDALGKTSETAENQQPAT